jgi:hypothetical protein
LNKIQEGIIKVTTQFLDGSPIEPKGINSKWRNDYGVLVREKCKITWIDWDAVPVNEKDDLWELIKAHYVFPFECEDRGKRATILSIGRALQRFKHALNKFYVQPGVSPFNHFGFVTPNEWNTFKELHTTSKAMAHSNRMKELIQKNKFKHRLGPGGYKATIPLWTKKEQELRLARIPDPLEGYTLHTRNYIWGRSHIHEKGQLVTSNSNITRVIENAKYLITKGKIGKFKPERQKDQLSAALEIVEHRGRTRAISSIA